MLELEMLLSKPEPRLVFPLFYKLSPGDLKRPDKLSQWRMEWEKLAARYENLKIESWEKLLRDLDSFNGEIYSPRTSEDDYIKRVVRQICNLVPSPAPYDLYQIRGHEYLAQEVARLFDHRRMVGLHGVGGLGKTTMCKIMVNFYNSKYPGRSCLIEFPTDGNKKNIVEECKRFLKQIFHLSEEHLLNNIHNFDQVIPLMRNHSREYDVFIAMDNIWSSSLEEAGKILQEFKNFGSGSKILLTSRSTSVIQDLLEPHGNACVESLPKLKEAEAVQIFEDSLGRNDVKTLINMSFVSKQCVFHQTFHPLALKAVGKYMEGVWKVEGEQNIELVMKDNMIKSVEDAVRINYDRLSADKKDIFLDIACLLPRLAYDITSELSYTEWLSLLYKDSKSKSDISNLINELALDGLIDHTVKRDIGANQIQMIITVHDLYVELGQKEVAKSLRFFVGGISSFKMEEIQWKRLERVILTEDFDGLQMFIAKLELQECPNLQVLCASGRGTVFAQGIRLDRMPSLCILQLDNYVQVRSIENWVGAAARLAVIVLSDVSVKQRLERIPSLPCLKVLCIKGTILQEGLLNLHGCTQLKVLYLASDDSDYYGRSFQNLEFLILSALKRLQKLSLRRLMSLKSLHGLSGLVQLESLEILDCSGLEEVTGLGALKSLQKLCFSNLSRLKSLHGLSGLVQLESLEIFDCSRLQEVTGLDALKSLRELSFRSLSSLKSLHGLSGLVQLESLEILDCSGLEEVTGLDALKSLRNLCLKRLMSLKSLHGLSGLVQLESLEILDCAGLEEVTGLNYNCGRLRNVKVKRCKTLKKVADLSALTCLQSLSLVHNDLLEEIGGHLSSYNTQLDFVCIKWCTRFPCLIKDCPHVKELHLSTLPADWNHLPNSISKLVLVRLKSVEFLIAPPLTSLKRLYLKHCKNLQKVSDLGFLTSLTHLGFNDCEALEEIGDLSALKSLEQINLERCSNLKRLVGLDQLPSTALQKDLYSADTVFISLDIYDYSAEDTDSEELINFIYRDEDYIYSEDSECEG